MKSEQEILDRLDHYYKVLKEIHQRRQEAPPSDVVREARRDAENYTAGLISALEWVLRYESDSF